MAGFSRPLLPVEIAYLIIDQLADPRSLCGCSLVSSQWLVHSRYRLLCDCKLLVTRHRPTNNKLIQAFSFVRSTLAPYITSIHIAGPDRGFYDTEYTKEGADFIQGEDSEYNELSRVIEKVLPQIPLGNVHALTFVSLTWECLRSNIQAVFLSLSNTTSLTLTSVTLGSLSQLISILLSFRNLKQLDIRLVLYPEPDQTQRTTTTVSDSPLAQLRSLCLLVEDRTAFLATPTPPWPIFSAEQIQILQLSAFNHTADVTNLIRAAGPSLTHLTLEIDGFALFDQPCPISLCKNTNISRIVIRPELCTDYFSSISDIASTIHPSSSVKIYIVMLLTAYEIVIWETVDFSSFQDSILRVDASLHIRLWYTPTPSHANIVRRWFRRLVEHGRLSLDTENAEVDTKDGTWWGDV